MTAVGLFFSPKIDGCARPCSAICAGALPVLPIEAANTPIDPTLIVPKLQSLSSGLSAITAPRACMTSDTLCGVSNAASVVIVSVSENGAGSFGLATLAGIAAGVMTMGTAAPIGIVAGSVAPAPDSV